MTTDGLDELVALPDGHKEKLARDVLSALGIDVLREQGDELIIGCPVASYHQDQQRNPTGALNASKLLFHCLGCGSGGTILWLAATIRDTTTQQARDWLRDEAGLSRAMDLPGLLSLFDSLYTISQPAPLPYYSERMLERLTGTPSYITGERGVPEETARRMGIVTDPEGRVGGVPTGPRAVIPHRWKGQLVGWQSRRLPGASPSAPKYHSTPGFPRDETIYNYPDDDVTTWRRRTRRTGHGVESPMSCLRHMHHTENMIGTFGDVITPQQIQLIGDAFDDFYWWPDPDPGGWRAVEGRTHRKRHIPGAMERLAARCRVYVVESPYDDDPAALDDVLVDQLYSHAVPWQIWQKPQNLLCAVCSLPSHKGQSCGVI